MLAVAKGDAVLVHMEGRGVPLAVRIDRNLQFRPCLAVILAPINRLVGRRVVLLNKGENFAVPLVHGYASTHKTFANGNHRTPSVAPIFTSLNDDPVPNGKNRAVHRHRDVGEATTFVNFRKIQLRLA